MPDTIRIRHKVIKGTQDGPHLLISGGVHGDEYEPMAAIRRLMGRIDPLTLYGRVTLIPVVNEPAFKNKNRRGPDTRDLARTFPGRPDGSITQRIAHAATGFIEAADYYIDLHTGGLAMKVSPLTGYTLHRDKAVLDVQRRMARAFNLPIIWGTTPNLDGRSLSVARDANIPAIYAEWMGGGGCQHQGVNDYVQGCLNVMAELKMIQQPQPPSRVTTIVEDARANSGHLQINCNAGQNGYFEPAVNLDDQVDVGRTLGSIVDPIGRVRETIRSTQKGIVLTLRALPRVEKGDCLAVILETEDRRPAVDQMDD